MSESSRHWPRTILILVVICGLGVAANSLVRTNFPEYFADTTVYSIAYEKPKGWIELVPGPLTLFLFRHPEGKGFIRASLNEVQARTNPTPELDTDGIAQHYIDITHLNMPEWKAERLPDFNAGTERFSLILRTKKERTVYTAFCSKGNSTLVLSLTAGGVNASTLATLVPEFRKVVESVKLTPKFVQIDD